MVKTEIKILLLKILFEKCIMGVTRVKSVKTKQKHKVGRYEINNMSIGEAKNN